MEGKAIDRARKNSRIEFLESAGDVRINKKVVSLSPTLYWTLVTLAGSPEKVFSRFEIVDSVHGPRMICGARMVDMTIGRLRKKLGDTVIKTKYGYGYQLGETLARR